MGRKKVIEEEPEEVTEWDKVRVVGFFVVVAALIAGGLFFKHFFLDTQNVPANEVNQSVQGISTQNSLDTSSQLPSVKELQQGAQQELGNLANQASKISVNDIASSSPQVQQILQEIKQHPQAPGNFAKQTCEQICNSL